MRSRTFWFAILFVLGMWSLSSPADSSFGNSEMVGLGNAVLRVAGKLGPSKVKFLAIGRLWVGDQYQALIAGYKKTNGGRDTDFGSNSNLRNKMLFDLGTAPVRSRNLSDRVDLPWSTCEIMQKFLILSINFS